MPPYVLRKIGVVMPFVIAHSAIAWQSAVRAKPLACAGSTNLVTKAPRIALYEVPAL